MKIYFASSIRGEKGSLENVKKIVEILKSLGHEVLTEHVFFEKGIRDEDIFKRDVSLVKSCDCFIAECTLPSLGVGYEVAMAENFKKPVLCLHQSENLSAMISGNKNIVVEKYNNNLKKLIEEFLKNI